MNSPSQYRGWVGGRERASPSKTRGSDYLYEARRYEAGSFVALKQRVAAHSPRTPGINVKSWPVREAERERESERMSNPAVVRYYSSPPSPLDHVASYRRFFFPVDPYGVSGSH
jgi:hypothetical protein